MASISDHLIQNLSYFFIKNKTGPTDDTETIIIGEVLTTKEVQNLKQAALRVSWSLVFFYFLFYYCWRNFFQAYASLGANDEDIRKRIIETDQLMDHVVSGLTECGDHRVQLAAVRCFHSLSRSVQQLRTTFQVLNDFIIPPFFIIK